MHNGPIERIGERQSCYQGITVRPAWRAVLRTRLVLLRESFRRRGKSRWLIACACFLWSISPLQADDLWVSGYFANSVTHYSSVDGSNLGSLTGGTVQLPQIARIGQDGLLYLANEGLNNVLRFDPRTMQFVDVFVSSGSGGLNGPTGLVFGPDGNLYVGSFGTNAILRYDGHTGTFIDAFVPSGSGGLNGPDIGVAFGPDGNLYVPSFGNNRVLRFDGSTGAFLGVFINGGLATLPGPRDIIFRPDGFVYVTSETGNKVARFNATSGAFVSNFVATGSGGLNGAAGMNFGNDGFLYVSSSRNDQVLRYDGTTGAFVNAFESGVDGPTGILNYSVPPPVPTMSAWGGVCLTFLLLIAGTLRCAKSNAG